MRRILLSAGPAGENVNGPSDDWADLAALNIYMVYKCLNVREPMDKQDKVKFVHINSYFIMINMPWKCNIHVSIYPSQNVDNYIAYHFPRQDAGTFYMKDFAVHIV